MEVISNNTIYYTLSTIAQTMAAIFAVMGTFLLFQIQSTESRIANLLNSRADKETMNNVIYKVKSLIALKKFKEAQDSFIPDDPFSGVINSDIENLANFKNIIRLNTTLSTTTIVLSVIILGLVDQMQGLCLFKYIFFSIIILFVSSLLIITRKIYLTLIIKDKKKNTCH